jgi:hypothetical protein
VEAERERGELERVAGPAVAARLPVARQSGHHLQELLHPPGGDELDHRVGDRLPLVAEVMRNARRDLDRVPGAHALGPVAEAQRQLAGDAGHPLDLVGVHVLGRTAAGLERPVEAEPLVGRLDEGEALAGGRVEDEAVVGHG